MTFDQLYLLIDEAGKRVKINEERWTKEGLPARTKVNKSGYALSARMHNGSMRIFVLLNEIEVNPWSDCGRIDKVRSFVLLPELQARVFDTVADLMKAAESIPEIIKRLDRRTGRE